MKVVGTWRPPDTGACRAEFCTLATLHASLARHRILDRYRCTLSRCRLTFLAHGFYGYGCCADSQGLNGPRIQPRRNQGTVQGHGRGENLHTGAEVVERSKRVLGA